MGEFQVKVCIVVDSASSAIGLAAKSRHNRLTEKILSASDFPTAFGLIDAIENTGATTVFFAWRGGLRNILQSRRCSKVFERKLEGRALGILIPDLLGLQAENLEEERKLLSYVDFYLVTSRELLARYLDTFKDHPPKGLYRDAPDVLAITEIRKIKAVESAIDVIWVGNSRWGVHYGMRDHKGFHEIVTPLMKIFEGKLKFACIDSAKLKFPHRKTLELINSSRILVQTSKSEGTGLPLLEAAGLGTVVLTTEVGVASEFLKGKLSDLIIPRNVGSFQSAIVKVYEAETAYSKLLMNRFDEYVEEIKIDTIPGTITPKSKDSSVFARNFTTLNHLKWLRRWHISRKHSPGFDS
jgi:glycosyltransferase involved in cell wall biosynthesis